MKYTLYEWFRASDFKMTNTGKLSVMSLILTLFSVSKRSLVGVCP